jgi:hypothetical protein
MGSSGIEELTQRIGAVRDRAAEMLATDGGARGRSEWPGRMLWLGLGIGIGVAVAGGRLMRVLPDQVVDRFDAFVARMMSAASGPAEVFDAHDGETDEFLDDASQMDEIDLTDHAPDAGSEGPIPMTGQ